MKFFKVLFSVVLLLLTHIFMTPARTQAQQPRALPAQIDTAFYNDMQFRAVGPTRGGRVTAVEGHSAHPYTFYMGAAGGGGVWRTTNYGQSWVNLTDGKGFKSTSIGAIEVAESDTSIIYVGTGSDGIRANVTVGRGVYKSTDAGKTWEFIGLEDGGQIGAIRVHPENPDLVYVAALGHPFGKNPQRGVFRSKDGGQTWEKVLFASDSTGAVDLELNPEDPDEIYAAMWRGERKPWTIISGADKEDGLYKSTDGGDHWTRLDGGLPKGLVGKINVAVTPADPDRLYALVEASGDKQGLYRSDNRGATWEQTSDTTGLMTRPFYFTNITAHPTHPDTVYVGNVRYWVSVDGGETFDRRPVTHADVHDLWINPERPEIQVQGNDGGATVTLDGGKTWSTQYNQPTAELYQVHTDDQFPYWLYAGQQDNTTISVPSLPPAESAESAEGLWHMTGGCETGPAVPQTNNPATVFANCKGRFGQYSTITGQERNYYVGAQYMYGRNPASLEYRFQRVVPIEISPHDSSVVYNGSQYVHRTTDGGRTWKRISPDLTAFKPQYQVASGGPINRDITGEEHYSTLYVIQESPHSPDVIWTGSNDGVVHLTRDGGKSWADVTPAELPENGRVDGIDPSPHNPGTAYLAVQRRLLDDFHPYIYRTTDYGQSWTLLSGGANGLPADHPVRVVREDPNREGLLYAGTDFGLFFSPDDGKHWQRIRRGLPVTTVSDIKVKHNDLVLSTMGRGFWILDNLTPLYRYEQKMTLEEHHLFAPADTYRMRYRSGADSDVPQYIKSGAMIDFYLAEVPEEQINLDILTQDGEIVRRFVGSASGGTGGKQAPSSNNINNDMIRPEPNPWGRTDSIEIRKGHNRFTWNLRYPAHTIPSKDGETYFGANVGPMAVPGNYKVRLSAGDWSQTRDFTLKIDPRVWAVGISVADLKAQHALNIQIRDAIGRAHRIAAQIDTLRNRFQSAENGGQRSAVREKLDALYNQIVTSEEGSYPPPMLIDQLEYLYYMTISADQRPGGDAYTRFKTLSDRLKKIRTEWRERRGKWEEMRADD